MTDCKCPRDAAETLIERVHRPGCPVIGKQRGKGGKASPASDAARKAKLVQVSIEGGKDALVLAAALAGFKSGSALVADVVRRIGKGEKLFRDPC